ncbi:uncharacterized protein LOC120445208 isoform X1 [Drosophila santomea]|uniref:uncharacterized protein LOC120445208 isoform X1 n=2 Tax=Drosophila santomea TaxID=129105 RepID=UPI0019537008|nr:uncharacterized protein LOC120445208 isoform X1 [Drosophila santomea]
MRALIALLLLITAWEISLSDPAPRSYENYSVYKVFIKSRSDQRVIDRLLKDPDNYNLWHRGVKVVHIMVSPMEKDSFLAVMRKENIVAKVIIKNVQTLINET